jgi:hypothetical protein
VIVTIIADNYFGYCKKEVKTQISYAANLFGLCEEEHAGGALVYPSYDLGEEFSGDLSRYPLWPGGAKAQVFDPVAAVFFDTNDGGSSIDPNASGSAGDPSA